MSQKKVKVNLNNENPLKTILKNGYIPVVRRAKTGFKNIDVSEYFKDICFKKATDVPMDKGCYCLIGGIQEFFDDSWQEDNIYIGFVKKDVRVYSLYGEKGYMTAGEKFAENLSNYALYYSNDDSDLEDFDYETRCIIDAKDISNVLVVEPNEFYNLVKYSNDGALKLLTIGDIFRINFYNKKIPQEFFKLIHFDNLEFKELEELLFSKYNCYLLKNLFDSYFKYVSGRQDLVNVNLKNYLDDIDEFGAWLDVYKDSFLKDYKSIDDFNLNYTDDACYFNFHKANKTGFRIRRPEREVTGYYISIYKNTSRFSRTVENRALYRDYFSGKISYNDYCINKDENDILNEKEIFCKDSLECLFVLLEVFEKYKKVFSKYYNIFTPDWVEKIKYLKNMCDAFNNMNVPFEFNEDLSKVNIVINDEISLEYYFDLKDFIVTIKEKEETYYYNIDNIPDEFEVERFIVLDFLDIIDIKFELSV